MKLLLSVFIVFMMLLQMNAQETTSSQKLKAKFGGALRFNYNYSNWKPNQQKRGGDFGFEMFKIAVDASYKKLELHIDQRFYSQGFGGSILKYGWLLYNFDKKTHLKLGLIPAYFGARQFNSHSWFFQLPFYLGFEDDHDMGISYSYNSKHIDLDIGFYKNSEELQFGDNTPISANRYSYDFSGTNKEVNQGNIRFNYKFGNEAQHIIGTSLQYGGIWNIETKEIGNHAALGIHYEGTYKRWNLQSQFITYNNNPKNTPETSRNFIEMSAYNFPYNTAAKAQVYSIGLAYTLPVDKGVLQSLQFYMDYAYMNKAITSWEDTQMNVTGILLSMKPAYLYFDYARGLNHPWLGEQTTDALTSGKSNAAWSTRFNINVGLYF